MVILLAYRRDGSGVVLSLSGSVETRAPQKNQLVKFSSDNTFEIHSVVGGYDWNKGEKKGVISQRGRGGTAKGCTYIATLRKQQRTLTIHGGKSKQNGCLTPSDPTD